jgi:hypothetical protein
MYAGPNRLYANDVESRVHPEEPSPGDPCRQEYLDCIRGRCIASALHMAVRDEHQSRRVARRPRCLVAQLPEKGPRNECECHSDGSDDKPDICLASDLFAGRVKSHASSIAVRAPVSVCSA